MVMLAELVPVRHATAVNDDTGVKTIVELAETVAGPMGQANVAHRSCSLIGVCPSPTVMPTHDDNGRQQRNPQHRIPGFVPGLAANTTDVAKALGDTVEAADDVDVDRESDRLMDEAPDADARAEAEVRSGPGDAQDVPDALRDEQANAEARKKAKSLAAAPTSKMVENAKDK